LSQPSTCPAVRVHMSFCTRHCPHHLGSPAIMAWLTTLETRNLCLLWCFGPHVGYAITLHIQLQLAQSRVASLLACWLQDARACSLGNHLSRWQRLFRITGPSACVGYGLSKGRPHCLVRHVLRTVPVFIHGVCTPLRVTSKLTATSTHATHGSALLGHPIRISLLPFVADCAVIPARVSYHEAACVTLRAKRAVLGVWRPCVGGGMLVA
jgi:hypothetical protein